MNRYETVVVNGTNSEGQGFGDAAKAASAQGPGGCEEECLVGLGGCPAFSLIGSSFDRETRMKAFAELVESARSSYKRRTRPGKLVGQSTSWWAAVARAPSTASRGSTGCRSRWRCKPMRGGRPGNGGENRRGWKG